VERKQGETEEKEEITTNYKTVSLFGYKWEVKNASHGLSPFKKVLQNRDLNESDLGSEELHDPWGFPDMEKAVKRIKKAISSGERIMVFGDYDADGVTGTAIIVRALKELGAKVSYRIPHRENDGYGLSVGFIDEFIGLSVKLIITVDCGIACPVEIEKASFAGIDTIITDHHDIPLEPAKAYAILHAKIGYTFRHLSGAGVAYKLVAGLLGTEAEKYLDLAAIGTVADIVPMLSENRAITRIGMQKMVHTKWPGLAALKKIAQIREEDLMSLDSDLIGYKLGPRINAAGRMDSPYISAQLLISDDNDVGMLAEKLDSINRQRQELVGGIMDDLLYDGNDKIIFVIGAWPKGVLGLIAGRISEKSGRPAIAMSEKDGILTGSARSHEYFHITEAFKKVDSLLEEYGGHKKAAGLRMQSKNLDHFKAELQGLMQDIDIPPRKLVIDCALTPGELNYDLVQDLERLKPFGEQNPHPEFLLKGFNVKNTKMVGGDGKHLKIHGEFGGTELSAIRFNSPATEQEIRGTVQIAGKIKKDSYSKEGYSLFLSDIEL